MLKSVKIRFPIIQAAILFLMFVSSAWADSATPLSGVQNLGGQKKYYEIKQFRIGGVYDLNNAKSFENGGRGGVTLEALGQKPLRLACITLGTAHLDERGGIDNAVVISPYYAGDASFSLFFWGDGRPETGFAQGAVIGPGLLIDTDKYYVILLDSLGLWGASKPSDGLGMAFPAYSLYDMVQANYLLLRDELGVSKIKLATGVSMGAIQTYLWALMHPEMVEAIMPIGGALSENSNFKWLLELMTAAMQSDPVWRETGGDYYDRPKPDHPNQGLMFGWSLLGRSGFSYEYQSKQSWSRIRKKVFYWVPEGDESTDLISPAENYDVNDLIFRNRCFDDFDISSQIKNIKARTLVIHVKNDQWLPYSEAEEAAAKIPGARLLGFESPFSHYGIFSAPNILKDKIESFVECVD